MEENKKDFFEIAYNASKKHWIWYTIILSFPSIWFPFLIPIFGRKLKLITEKGEFSICGIIASFIVVLTTLIIAFLNNRHASKSEFSKLEKLEGNVHYFETILDSVDRICDEKDREIIKTITKVKNKEIVPPRVFSDPQKQLKKILEEMVYCIVIFMDNRYEHYSEKDFYVTLAYNFPQENKEWNWLDGTLEKGLSLKELLKSRNNTTFNYLKRKKYRYYFNNKKEDAEAKHEYLYDTFDQTYASEGEKVGSIFCWNYKIRTGSKLYVDALLSITTQGKRFCDEDDVKKIENVKKNFIKLAETRFGKRVLIDLGLLYLDSLYNTQQ